MKKKLSLQADALRVESFDTGEAADARGTVEANDAATGTKYPKCPATGCTCGIDPRAEAELDARTFCYCCA